MSKTFEEIMKHVEAKRRQIEAEYRLIAQWTGMTIEEIDADLTAPNPGAEEE